MEQYLRDILRDAVPPQEDHPIWQKADRAGHPYWGTGDFCGLGNLFEAETGDLTELEWNGNEVNLSGSSDILHMLILGLGILTAWKKQMELDYAVTPFDLVLSIDPGDEEVPPSVTLRFYAVREEEHIVSPSVNELERFCQPILMEQVNTQERNIEK